MIFKKMVMILVGCIVILSSGCVQLNNVATFGRDTVDVLNKSNVIKGQYQTVSYIIKKHQNDFTEQELKTFSEIDVNARMIYSKIQSITDIKHFDVNPDEIKYLHALAQNSYKKAKSIIVKHEDKFDVIELTKMKMFDVQLIAMDNAVKTMLENPDTVQTRQALDTILKVASVSLKIILPLVI